MSNIFLKVMNESIVKLHLSFNRNILLLILSKNCGWYAVWNITVKRARTLV